MPAEEALAMAKNKIWSDIKVEMAKQGYTTTSLAQLLNVNRPTVSFAIHGGTTPRDITVRKRIYKVLRMEDY
ncbi:MAG: helix-turn-helix domain-containing protein [Lactobacillus sp.]|nr:helix-turn-helix domain-containing protein [Lactobacillus sp.]